MYTDSQRRTHIYDLQRFLRRVQQAGGHPQPLIPDGIFGPETSAGLRAFQQQNGLPVTGTADLDTWTLLYDRYLALAAADLPPAAPAFFPTAPDATLRADSRGPAVFVLQLLLSSAVPHFTDTAPSPHGMRSSICTTACSNVRPFSGCWKTAKQGKRQCSLAGCHPKKQSPYGSNSALNPL